MNFVEKENQKRTSQYKKNHDEQKFLQELNLKLCNSDAQNLDVDHPSIYIFGLPRSGTTLTYQLLSFNLDIGYVNNLIAKFWLAPVQGIKLSQSLSQFQGHADYQSDRGKSLSLFGPHEFSYFWQHWLKIETERDMVRFNTEEGADRIDWNDLKLKLKMMQAAFGKGLVHKTMYAGNFIREFHIHSPMSLFIYVERAFEDVALSILESRIKYYGNKDEWWATLPPNYYEVSEKPFDEQITHQIYGLKRAYEEAISLIPTQNVIRINYTDICSDPTAFLRTIRDRLRSLYGYEIGVVEEHPKSFKFKTYETNKFDAMQKKVLHTLKAFGEPE